MNEQEIRESLESAFAGSDIQMMSEGNKIGLRIVSQEFEGLSRVKRQQKVYAVLDDLIKSGVVHAVSMQCLTPDEAEA